MEDPHKALKWLQAKAASKTREETVDDSGIPYMTAERIKLACIEHQGYETPELNDRLYLHYSGFRKIENLEPYTGLKAIWLDSNGISSIDGLAPHLAQLRCLYLHQNMIEKIQNLHGLEQLQTLNLSNNRITVVEGLSCLPRLQTLNLSKNAISDVSSLFHLADCVDLNNLDVSDNLIEGDAGTGIVNGSGNSSSSSSGSVPAIMDANSTSTAGSSAPVVAVISLTQALASIPKLATVYLKGNPCVRDTRNYRKVILSALPKLRYLDDRPVFESERLATDAWAKGGHEAELQARREYEDKERDKSRANMERFQKWQEEVRTKRKKELEDMNKAKREAGEEEVTELPRKSYVSYSRVSAKYQTESARLQRLTERAEKLAKAGSLHGTAIMDLGRQWWVDEGVLDANGNVVKRHENEEDSGTTEKDEEEEQRRVDEQTMREEREEHERERAERRRQRKIARGEPVDQLEAPGADDSDDSFDQQEEKDDDDEENEGEAARAAGSSPSTTLVRKGAIVMSTKKSHRRQGKKENGDDDEMPALEPIPGTSGKGERKTKIVTITTKQIVKKLVPKAKHHQQQQQQLKGEKQTKKRIGPTSSSSSGSNAASGNMMLDTSDDDDDEENDDKEKNAMEMEEIEVEEIVEKQIEVQIADDGVEEIDDEDDDDEDEIPASKRKPAGPASPPPPSPAQLAALAEEKRHAQETHERIEKSLKLYRERQANHTENEDAEREEQGDKTTVTVMDRIVDAKKEVQAEQQKQQQHSATANVATNSSSVSASAVTQWAWSTSSSSRVLDEALLKLVPQAEFDFEKVSRALKSAIRRGKIPLSAAEKSQASSIATFVTEEQCRLRYTELTTSSSIPEDQLSVGGEIAASSSPPPAISSPSARLMVKAGTGVGTSRAPAAYLVPTSSPANTAGNSNIVMKSHSTGQENFMPASSSGYVATGHPGMIMKPLADLVRGEFSLDHFREYVKAPAVLPSMGRGNNKNIVEESDSESESDTDADSRPMFRDQILRSLLGIATTTTTTTATATANGATSSAFAAGSHDTTTTSSSYVADSASYTTTTTSSSSTSSSSMYIGAGGGGGPSSWGISGKGNRATAVYTDVDGVD